jgi:hypothetical protein
MGRRVIGPSNIKWCPRVGGWKKACKNLVVYYQGVIHFVTNGHPSSSDLWCFGKPMVGEEVVVGRTFSGGKLETSLKGFLSGS